MVGFDAKNKRSLEEKYTCPICLLIIRDPVQLIDCGHRFCQTCTNTEQDTTTKCDQCQLEISRENVSHDQLPAHYLTEQHQNALINAIPRGTETSNAVRHCETSRSSENQYTLLRLSGSTSGTNSPIEQRHDLSEVVNNNPEIVNQDPNSLQKKTNDLQKFSSNDAYTWTITNVKEKMNEAQSGKETSIYSPPFYLPQNGYKMRAHLFLNGDGNARHTHMSLFLQLMRGDHDRILRLKQRHIIDSFLPDTKSSSFQRPVSDMNIASGIPKFVPLPLIQHEGNPYLRNDTMLIQISIDLGEFSKRLLPSALSLNPNVFDLVQQTRANQGTRRRLSEDAESTDQNKKTKT
ncbi:unnamed protein product [Rotaria sordida]|uniref:RING-type domain-containing protein n=2 Tax=Rotaria sordida TaxID=392033 RepID=A0A819J292_9BILA|nr:unnamed protein product [Rotaria sordida]